MDSKDKKSTTKNHTFMQSLGHAIDGVSNVFKFERNFKFHLSAGFIVLICGYIFKLTLMEWVIIIGCIGSVLVVETINTAVEHLADLITEKQYHPLAKSAKDIAAGAVLLTALVAAIIGLLIFGSKII